MRSRHLRFTLWAVAAIVVGASVMVPARIAIQAALPANVTVNPTLFKELFFRPLTNFARGGRVTAVTGVPSNPQLYYMGTAGGVWRTTNAGARWEPLTDGQIGVGSIGAIAVAPSDPNVLYVGTGSACPRGNVSNGDGVYKSTDAGKTWKHIGLPKAGLIGRIRIHPTNPNLAYAAVLGNIFGPNPERGVFRTKDGGATWEHVLKISEHTGAADLDLDTKNPNVLIAGMWAVRRQPWSIDSGSMDGGVFRSTDGGSTWTKLASGLPKGAMTGRIGVTISAANPKRMYAQIEAADTQGGVYRTDDGGETWTRSYAGRNLQQRAFYYTHIIADPVEPDTVYALNTGAFKSTDGGKTFQNAGIQTHGDHHDLWINPTNNKFIVNGNDGGATVSLDGRAWSGQETQPTQEIYRITTDNRWPYYVYGAQQDNSTIAVPSQGQGENYPVGGGESGHISVDPRNYNIVYAGSYGGSITRMDRYTGVTESVRVYPDSQTGQKAADMKYRFQWNAPIRVSRHNPDTVYYASQYVHKTTDGGQTWTLISGDLSRNDRTKQQYSGALGVTRDSTGVEVYSVIFALEESPSTAGMLWAGSDDGLLHLTRDEGKTWEKITPTGLPEHSVINAIDLSPSNPGRAIVTAYRYMQNDPAPYAFLTNDFGKTWKRIADGTNGIPAGHFLRVVREDRDRQGLLFGGTEYGLYVSFDEGAHWQPFQNNLPIVPIMDMVVFRKELAIATEGRGFWIFDGLPVLQQFKSGTETDNVLFKPVDAHREGGPVPTFYYWLKDAPTTPVSVEITDPAGAVVYTATGQPGSGANTPPSPVPGPAGGGRGRGGGGAGISPEQIAAMAAGRGVPPEQIAALLGIGTTPPAGAAPAPAQPAQPAGEEAAEGGRGGRGGGGRGRGGGGGFGPLVSAHQGLNRATWNARLAPLFTVPQGIVMWGGGGGGGGPKAAPGVYTFKVTAGAWTASQPFRLMTDPRLPQMTEEEGQAQLKLAREVGGTVKRLYDDLGKIRNIKMQIDERVKKQRELANRAKALTDKLVMVEGEITQLQGEGGQDALNFPGRIDNQWVVLYQTVANLERKPNKGVMERLGDLTPPTDQLLKQGDAVMTKDLAEFNEILKKANLPVIEAKPPEKK